MGVIVANWLIGKVVGVERFNDRVMKVNTVIGDAVWEEVSCYCPQAGRSANEKEEFYELMDKVVKCEKTLVGGDFNGHVGSDMGGFREVHGGFGIGQINNGWIRLLDWAVGKGLCLMNTCFQKRKSRLITFRSGETKTMIDYILVNNKYRSSVKDMKVTPGENIMSQHCLLLMDMVFKKKVKRKVKFRNKLKLWKLREPEVKEDFETWWWNKDVDVAVCRRRELFRI